MSFESILETIKQKVGTDSGLNGSIKFVVDNDKFVHVDATVVPNVVSTEDKPADCTIKASTDTIMSIISGQTNSMMAFMMGKIKIEGNISLATHVTKIL